LKNAYMDKNFSEKPDWSQYEELWLSNYNEANYDKGLSAKVLRKTHKIIETDKALEPHYSQVLELGAGTMAHFPTVAHGFDKYIASDHDPKVIKWLKSKEWDSRVEIALLSGGVLPFEDNSMDRVIATHVLEHVKDPVSALEEWVRVTRPGGVISLILPSDPGFAWRLGRALGPRRKAEKNGLPYDYYMAIEHINAIFNLREVIAFHFPKRTEKWWPFHVAIPDINLIYGVNCYI